MTTNNSQKTQNNTHMHDDNTSRNSSTQHNTSNSSNSNKGFASMEPEKQREIASKGGREAHRSGNAHEFDSEEAREAGRKGGQNSHQATGGSGSSNQNR